MKFRKSLYLWKVYSSKLEKSVINSEFQDIYDLIKLNQDNINYLYICITNNKIKK